MRRPVSGATDVTPPRAGSGELVLEAQDITKRYASRRVRGGHSEDNSVLALDSVSLSVSLGEIYAVVGESGSGKSTLGRHLLGMEKPDSGVVRFRGQDVHSLDRDARRVFQRSIQVVLQDPSSSLNPRMRIGAILAEPLAAVQAIPRSDFEARIIDTLEKVNLPADSVHRYPHQFSVGQRQRIAIARAIAVRPQVIIMDEPVSSLDVSVAARVLDLIVDLRDQLEIGLVLISHNLGHVWKIAQKVAVMQSGVVVERGDVHEVFSQPAHAYTRALLAAVPRIQFAPSGGTGLAERNGRTDGH